MNPDDKHLRTRPGRLNASTPQHMRVRRDHGSAPPTALDDPGGTGSQGDQRMRGREQDVLLLGVGSRVVMMRVA
jgi:hypothetical protein